MALCVWKGGAFPSVNQVSTVTVGGTISGQTFTISVEHPSGVGTAVVIASYTDTDTVAATVATNLQAQWAANNHDFARGNDDTAPAFNPSRGDTTLGFEAIMPF